MLLYLYTSKNSVFSYLSRNLIAPTSIMPDGLGIRTVGLLNDDCLFVTHKRVNEETRYYGISDREIANPITLTIEIDEKQENNRCVLVSVETGAIKTEIATWKEYDVDKQIGAYIIGEIPFSLVKKIYFENKKQQEEFYRPSSDYWYPENKFAELPASDFNETLDISVLQQSNLKSLDIDYVRIKNNIIYREKMRAALLCLTDATQKWNYGDVLLNIDSVLQSIIGSDIVTDSIIQAQIPDCTSMPITPFNEELNLLPLYKWGDNQSLNQEIYNTVLDYFCSMSMEKDAAIPYYEGVLNKVIVIINTKADAMIVKRIKDFAEETLNVIMGKVIDKTIEEILAQVPKGVDCLPALFFVMRQPDDYEKLLTSLKIYCHDPVVARRACTLFGALNGTGYISGEDTFKSNQELWKFIEWKVIYETVTGKEFVSLVTEKPEILSKEMDKFLHIPIYAGRNVSMETIMDLLKSKEIIESIPEQFFAKLIMNVKDKKNYYQPIKATKTKPFSICIQAGEEYNPKRIEQFKKDFQKFIKELESPFNKKTKAYDKLAFFTDYVNDKKKFKLIYDKHKKEWEEFYKNAKMLKKG